MEQRVCNRMKQKIPGGDVESAGELGRPIIENDADGGQYVHENLALINVERW